ncbi:PREDICTED: uncharacterized protein LOC106125735 [Papilio xuthus]|uniref:Uncharacterized protein LOC106125735 n=1 Tax=Papilio xuthus TaxID=66420 RepID=A0AAJ6ZSR4_PAPXU|nr:PREDICTED: uncharacterized protein LOC106125735 [Papilio xuthus]
MILWNHCLSISLLIVITDSKSSNVRKNTKADNDFTEILHSIIKINEKRINSLKTLIDLDDYNKARALRNKLNDGIKKHEIIGIIIGEVENTSKDLLKYNKNIKRRHNNGGNRHGKKMQSLGNYKVETIVKPISKDSGTSSSEMDCNPNQNNCNGNGRSKCQSECSSYCVDSCNNAFKHFCLTYACDYSMKAQMEHECSDYCSGN